MYKETVYKLYECTFAFITNRRTLFQCQEFCNVTNRQVHIGIKCKILSVLEKRIKS